MQVQLQPEFDQVLQLLGSHALEFFLAASLYHARKSALPVPHTWLDWTLTPLKPAYRSFLNKAMSSLMNASWKIYTL